MGKVYNLCRVKTDISAVLTVKSGLDPHMINKLEDEINHGPCLWYGYVLVISLLFLLIWVWYKLIP
jgi:hypothetical protein